MSFDCSPDKLISRFITINDFSRICRVCLIYLDERNIESMSIHDLQVSDLLDYSVQIKIDNLDGLPQNVCVDCIKELLRCYKFKHFCLNSDAILKALVQDSEEFTAIEDKPIEIDLHSVLDDKSMMKELIAENTKNTSSNIILNEDGPNEVYTDILIDSTLELDYGSTAISNIIKDMNKSIISDDEAISTDENNERSSNDELEKKTINEERLCPKLVIMRCGDCQEMFKSKDMLMNHRKETKHGSTQKSPCEVSIEAIQSILCKEQEYSCEICLKVFNTKQKVKAHQLIHQERIYECDKCGKAFYSKSSLKIHSYVHVKRKPYKCNLCTKTFTQRCQLDFHLNRHTGEKKYKCLTCGKIFYRQSILQVHLRLHTGEKPYTCTVCKKSFRQISNRNSHVCR